ncbi:hypothetical protein [Mesorhizobium loti]|uniref:hypothetical protein n=1 Tax=Rhizobium loti TaxID=381 RepID=UPI0014735149|nr:hypothetical protein [Mesorhizobium loti]
MVAPWRGFSSIRGRDTRQARHNLHRQRIRETALAHGTDAKDKAEALAAAKEIGDKVRVEEITPKAKKR